MPVKTYRSKDLGAPALHGSLGQLIVMLDAVLVNGYNQVSVTSLTRTGDLAAATCAAPHGLSSGDYAAIAGAAQGDYNGEFPVTVTGDTTFTYDVANTPTSPATGTISAKRAPLGYTKVFTGENRAAYRANDIAGLRHYLRVQDDGTAPGGAREAKMWGYESMTGIDSGTNVYPTTAQSVPGYYQAKSSTLNTVSRPWMLVGDGRLFYLLVDHNGDNTTWLTNSSNGGYLSAFGDVISYRAGDAYASIISGHTGSYGPSTSAEQGLCRQATSITSSIYFSSSICIARDYTAVVGSRYVDLLATGFNATFGAMAYMPYPHYVDNGFYVTPVQLVQGNPALIRGQLPGMYEGLHGRAINNQDILENVQGLEGRKLAFCYVQSSSSAGSCLIDLTGPWRP